MSITPERLAEIRAWLQRASTPPWQEVLDLLALVEQQEVEIRHLRAVVASLQQGDGGRLP